MAKAIIFDMDGVVSNTQKLHAKVEKQVLQNHGVHLTEKELTDEYAGMLDEEFFPMIIKKHRLPIKPEIIIKEKWDKMWELTNDHVPEVPGATNLIKLLKSNNYKLAIASSSSIKFIKHILNRLGLENQFDTITSGNEVKHGKPEPDIFLLTAKRLDIEPQNCIVIEDGYSGMIAAKKSGMKCIGLVEDEKARSYPADLLVTGLEQLTLQKIGDF